MLAAYSLNVGKAKITTQLNINNLLDKYYFSGIGTQNGGLAGYQQGNADFGAPRTFMGSVSIQY
jgi:iron complex outermembrane receptor protein